MAVVGTAVIDVIANTAKLEAGIKRAERSLGAFTSQAGKMAGVAAGVAATAVVLLTKRSMENIDALAKQADMLNTSTEALGAYKVQASLAGVDSEKFTNALRKMITNIGDVRDGTGEAADSLKLLGLSVTELAGMRADEQFEAIAEKIKGLATQADRANAAARIFGERDGVKMLNLISEMGPQAEELRAQLVAMGVTFSRIDAAKVEAANDAFELAQQSAVGLGNTIAISVSPFIEQMANKWIGAAVAAGGFRDSVQHGMMAVSVAVGVVADVLRGVHVGLKSVELAAYGAAAATNLVLQPFLNPEIVQASIDNLMRVRAEYDALVASPMPSEGIREGFFEIIEGADQAAAALAKAKQAASGLGGAITSVLDPDEVRKANEKLAAQIQKENDEQSAAVVEAELVLITNRAEEAFTAMSVFADQAARNMQSAFAEFLFDPFKEGLGGMLRGFADILRRMVAEAMAARIFEAIGAWGTANQGAGLFASIAGFFGGGRASGGPVAPGMMYEVNERGPELLSAGGRDYLMTGNQGGRVSPVSPAKASGRPVINLYSTINAPGAGPELLARLPALLDERERRLTRAIFDALDRGYA